MPSEAPGLPVIWPEPRPGFAYPETKAAAPQPFALYPFDRLFGIGYDVDDRGVDWLAGLLEAQSFRCKLIIVLYPACATRQEHLIRLTYLEEASHGRLEVRLFPVFALNGPLSVLGFLNPEGTERLMVIGSAPNLGAAEPVPGEANFLFRPEPSLFDVWCAWFNQLWEISVPLREESVAVPPLVPAKGSPEAGKMWAEYLESCYALASRGKEEELFGDEQTEDSALPPQGLFQFSAAAEGQISATAELGIPRLDPLEKRVAQLYKKGFLVSFDKESRPRPLEIPVKPEWLEVERSRRVGAATRSVAYRVSIFDEADLRSLKRKKEAARELLKRFSFSLADGQWWIPCRAVTLFEKELERVNSEGLEQLGKIIGNDTKKFLENRKEKILKDLEVMYREFHPGKPLPKESAKNILSAVENRLQEIGKERLLPKVSYAEVGFSHIAETRWRSPWAQVLALLSDIAEFPRKAMTDIFFLRGVRVEFEELIEAMDVCDDVIVKLWREGSYARVKDRAARELVLLKEIMSEQVEPRAKCEAILGLIDGATHEEIRQKLKMPKDICDSGFPDRK
ncbi:MAG: hypothetical protein K6U74_20010 [Firmicutes bacterium]|nr:hypothetical protein [Bacillota bacterium]